MTRSPETRREKLSRYDKCQAVGPEVEAQLAEDVEHDRDAVELLRLHRDLVGGSDDNEEDAEDSLLDTKIRAVHCLFGSFYSQT